MQCGTQVGASLEHAVHKTREGNHVALGKTLTLTQHVFQAARDSCRLLAKTT